MWPETPVVLEYGSVQRREVAIGEKPGEKLEKTQFI